MLSSGFFLLNSFCTPAQEGKKANELSGIADVGAVLKLFLKEKTWNYQLKDDIYTRLTN